MKKIHFAWIEQILSFDTEEERDAYIAGQEQLAAHKKQAPVQIISKNMVPNEFSMFGKERYSVRIRKPYNGSPIYEGR